MKKFLYLASFLAFISMLMSVATGSLIIIGINFITFLITLLFAFTEDETIKANNKLLLGFSVVMLPFNVFYTVTMMIMLSKTDFNWKVKKEVIDPKIKRINNLLKVGIGLILLSGITFVSSTWSSIDDLYKVVLLTLSSFLFLLAYRFVKLKLKLEKTAKSYWIIGYSLLSISFLAVGILGVFNSWFSLYGEGSDLFISVWFIFMSSILYLTANEFKNDNIKYSVYSLSLLSLAWLLNFFINDVSIVILIMTLIDFTLSYFKFDERKDNFIFTLSYLTPIVFIMFIRSFTSNYILVITGAMLLFNLLYPVFGKKDLRNVHVIMPFIYSILLAVTMLFFDNIKIDSVIIYLIMHIAYFSILIFKQFRNDIFAVVFTTVLTNFGLFVLYLGNVYGVTYKGMYVAVAMLIINAISLLIFSKKELNMEKYFLPIKVLLAIYAVITYMSNFVVVDMIYFLTVSSIIYFIMYIFIKDVDMKKMNLSFVLFAALIAIFVNRGNFALELVFTFIMAIYTFVVYRNNQLPRLLFHSFYALTLINLFIVVTHITTMYDMQSSITIALILLSLVFIKKDDKVDAIAGVILFAPLAELLTSTIESYATILILKSYLLLLTYYLTLKFNAKNRDAIRLSITVVVLATSVFGGVVNALYVGIISLFLMLSGVTNIKNDWRFTTGVIFTVFNAIYHLREVLVEIPLWTYLLVTGLVIIGFVTYAEVKKMETK